MSWHCVLLYVCIILSSIIAILLPTRIYDSHTTPYTISLSGLLISPLLTKQICSGPTLCLNPFRRRVSKKVITVHALSSLPSCAESEKLQSSYYFKSDVCKWLIQIETRSPLLLPCCVISDILYAFLWLFFPIYVLFWVSLRVMETHFYSDWSLVYFYKQFRATQVTSIPLCSCYAIAIVSNAPHRWLSTTTKRKINWV